MEIFCSKCQSQAEQSVNTDSNGEIVFTCPACTHSIKFASMPTKEQLELHEKQNKK